MDGRQNLFVCLLILGIATGVLSSNCYGGGYGTSLVTGGSASDSYNDISGDRNTVTAFAVGVTSSSDFLYDYSFGNAMNPPDATLAMTSHSSLNSMGYLTFVTSGSGSDAATGVDVNSYLCTVGYTGTPSAFPYTSAASNFTTSPAVWVQIFNASFPNIRLLSVVQGDSGSSVYAPKIACSPQTKIAYVVSGAGNAVSWDIRLTQIDISSGSKLYDAYFGSSAFDDFPTATDFFQNSQGNFWLIAGYGYSTSAVPIANAYQAASAGSLDGYVWVANTNTTIPSWKFATFFGGSNEEVIYTGKFDEVGNVYVAGFSTSSNLPMKNAFNSTYCGGMSDGCVFLAVFDLQGQLLMSTWMDVKAPSTVALDVSKLEDNGHLVYITGTTTVLEYNTMEYFQYTLTNASANTQDIFIKILYVSSTFTTSELRLSSLFGGSNADTATGITVLANNSFAIAGSTYSTDFPSRFAPNANSAGLNSFTAYFKCGEAIAAVSPSPTPIASSTPTRTPSSTPAASSTPVPSSSQSPVPSSSNSPAPSPPSVSCEASDGCYSSTGIYVQFETDDDGEYTPTQTIFTGTETTVEPSYYLNVDYLTLDEHDEEGNLIASVPFPSSGYQLSSETQMINGVNVSVVTFTTELSNGASVDVINYFYEEAGTLTFAGTNVAVPASTSKTSVRISSWSFNGPSSTLTLNTEIAIAPAAQGPPTQVSSGNQTQFSFDTGVTTCSVSSLSVIETDGGISSSSISVASFKKSTRKNISSATLQVTFPSFTDYVLYDPGYSVLVKDQESSSSSKEDIPTWAYIAAGCGAFVIVAGAVATGFVVMSSRNKKMQKNLQHTEMELQ